MLVRELSPRTSLTCWARCPDRRQALLAGPLVIVVLRALAAPADQCAARWTARDAQSQRCERAEPVTAAVATAKDKRRHGRWAMTVLSSPRGVMTTAVSAHHWLLPSMAAASATLVSQPQIRIELALRYVAVRPRPADQKRGSARVGAASASVCRDANQRSYPPASTFTNDHADVQFDRNDSSRLLWQYVRPLATHQ